MTIGHQKVVTINYTLRDDEGTILDSSEGREPLAYIQGMGNLISGLENALEGKSAGESLSVSIPPAEAYGEYDESLVAQVSRSQFTGIDNLEVGMQFHTQSQRGDHIVTITEINGDTITVNGNHALAGMTLHFNVDILNVREATPDEISHGHVHGAGGHHH